MKHKQRMITNYTPPITKINTTFFNMFFYSYFSTSIVKQSVDTVDA